MPICPNCCSPLKKRNNAQGKYYHCVRHGFVRDIGTPEPSIAITSDLLVAQTASVWKSKHIKLKIGAKNV